MLPVNAINTGFVKRLAPLRRVTRLGFFAVVAALSGNMAFAGDEDRAPIVAMVDLCLAGPTSLDQARATLTGTGWVEDVGGPEERGSLITALTSVIFALRFDPNDAGFSAFDATFMAASVLGNSPLGQNQLGFSLGEVKLGVLGIEKHKPQCAVVGPEWILQVATERHGLASFQMPKAPKRPVDMRRATIDGAEYYAARVDLEAVAALDPQIGSERNANYRMSRDAYDQFIAAFINVANIHIASKTRVQER